MLNHIFSVEENGVSIQANVCYFGDDVCINIYGGHLPHIGTITTRSITGDMHLQRFMCEGDLIHKDDFLSDIVLKEITSVLKGVCVITSGVHIDNITKEQIQLTLSLTEKMAKEVKQWLIDNQKNHPKPEYSKFS